jgi:hypothetical protein
MGAMMAEKKQAFLFQTVMGNGELVTRTYKEDPDALQRLERNRQLFASLPQKQQDRLLSAYQQTLETKNDTPFVAKLGDSLSLILFKLPAFDRAWIFFAIIVSIMLLLKAPGAPFAAWILPLIVLAAALDNQGVEADRKQNLEEALFPSEKYLVATYMKSPLDSNIFRQQDQLKEAWQHYLVHEWAKEAPSENENLYREQVQSGEWHFNLARLQRSLQQQPPSPYFVRKEPISIWIFYFIWNVLFAWMASRNQFKKEVAANRSLSPQSSRG